MFPDLKGLLNDKLKEADKKYEPQGGLAVMMTLRDAAALEALGAFLNASWNSDNRVTHRDMVISSYEIADMFLEEKKKTAKSS